MCIFKDITHRYCQKILDAYQAQVDEKTYKGKEAELLIQRNEIARDLVTAIKEIEFENDYVKYFDQVLNTINAKLKEATSAVLEYNKKYKTSFTTDLYETFFTASLISFINALSDLVQSSPQIIVNIKDESLFTSKKDAPWFYHFSSVLYEYILDKEFEFATTNIDRDIFDAKKTLILKYIQNAGNLFSRYENENEREYQELMKVLLNSLCSEEKDIQRRKTEEPNSGYVYAYLSQSFYKASEKIIGKNQLGQKIELLTKEFSEKSTGKELSCN
ncbi:hypothetical protein OQJ13_09980 [Legionella sp. PATHC035]|uniref:hypothetical protein n=1 Tax=Legionella sp. PATHC035 TaxID=2992040 RepID=UPI002244E6E8|nr:hypothetical protein [Legionella sp. PATHC035]MCW8409301.1 hypothetical protein [Legionella sp. PATHC035]